jgi:NADH-quinone oxidoreductase subunit A
MYNSLFMTPPLAFLIVLFTCIVIGMIFSAMSFKRKDAMGGAHKAYACGEEFTGHMIQPDYSQFFQFAFFFTILHVVVLVITIVPVQLRSTFVLAIGYLVAAAVCLVILLRK